MDFTQHNEINKLYQCLKALMNKLKESVK